MVLMAMPRPVAVLGSRMVGAAVLLSLSIWLIPGHGAAGAAAALIVGEMSSTLLLFFHVRRATGGVPWTARCASPLLAGATAAVLYKLIFSWPLLLKLPLAALAYCTLALVLKAVTLAEFQHLPALMRAAAREEKTGSEKHGAQKNSDENRRPAEPRDNERPG
jgi:O-antigen/teichoic acid export membrane protein